MQDSALFSYIGLDLFKLRVVHTFMMKIFYPMTYTLGGKPIYR